MVPEGLAGLMTSTPLSGRSAWTRSTASAVITQPAGGIRLDLHRLDAESLQDVAVGGIAGRGDGHAVAGVEQSEEAEDEPARRSRGDHDPLGRDADLVGVAVVPRDALAQRGHAQRLRVADPAMLQGAAARPRSPDRAPGAPGWPTSMCSTLAPAASRRLAAASTSMAWNGCTSLRLEGCGSRY